MIIVTGASGKLGSLVAEHLLEKISAEGIGVSVRDPEKASGLSRRGARVRRGDFEDASSLRHAFEGATQVLLVSSNARATRGDTLAQHRTAIESAKAVGARRVLYTSHMGARADSPFAPALDHAATETLLAQASMPFTSLRHGFYAESALFLVGRGFDSGEIRAPEDGPVSWTARADLAEADAVVLTAEGCLTGITPPLTASKAITLADVAALASEMTGREVKRVTVTDEEWREAQVAQGLPAPVAEMLLGTYRAARRGDFAAVDPTLERLLGRSPTSMREFLAGHLSG